MQAQQQSLPPWQEAMASTTSAPAQSPGRPGSPNGGMEELLPLVLQLTNAEQVCVQIKDVIKICTLRRLNFSTIYH